MTRSADLTRCEVEDLLRTIGDDLGLVVVGGQAVNFWAEHFAQEVPQLAAFAPFTSRDLDLAGPRSAVETCAARLGGKATLAQLDDGTNSGLVVFRDKNGAARQIDVLNAPAGLASAEVNRRAIPVDILDATGQRAGQFLVLHPVLCVRACLANLERTTALLHATRRDSSAYPTAFAEVKRRARQTHAAILFTPSFLRHRLVDTGGRRAVLDCNEEIAHAALKPAALDAHEEHGLDLLEAILTDSGGELGDFTTKRLPQIQAMVERKRAARAKRTRQA